MARGKAKKSVVMQRAKRSRAGRRPAAAPKAREIEAALAALAHEVRTPLTGILALGELLSACDLPERERDWAAAIKSAAEHLAQLTTIVVDGAKAGGRNFVLRQEPFRPRLLAEAVGASLIARAETKGVRGHSEITNLPDVVIGDPVRLRAALENLVDNAVKFTERGEVALTVACEPAQRGRIRLIFAVEDSGVGLSAQEIRQLFRPFHQASKAVARTFGGAGLGLAFVKRVAKAMGGDVTVESTPGGGSIFRLDVIVTRQRQRSQAAGRKGAVRELPRASLRVLCAEDNPYSRVVLKTILTELGHAVDFVGTGEAAVAAVERGGYDVVLMDVVLPGMGGIAATRRIRTGKGAARQTPIVGLSGRSEPGEEATARAAGMNDYLVKPVSPSALAAALAKAAS
jgi:CheY-like chemotaxis protein/nitrogen-specific signal transduction histidine kinase